jgi:hypothetical protein
MSNVEKKLNGILPIFGSDKKRIIDPIVTSGFFEYYTTIAETHN